MDPASLLLPGADLGAAIANAPPGAALLLAPGSYHVDGPLLTRNDLLLTGAGAAATTVTLDAPDEFLWHHAGPGTLTLRGLALRQGQRASRYRYGRANLLLATGGALDVADCAFVALEGGVEPLDEDEDYDFGWFVKCGGTAIVLRQDARARIHGCAFARAPQAAVQDTQGVEVELRASATITRCHFDGLHTGVEVAVGATLDLADSRFTGCNTGATCSWWEDSYDAREARPHAPRQVTGCTFVRNGLALLVGGPQRTLVKGCTFSANQRPLIVREDGADLVGNAFTDNVEGVADPFGRAVYRNR